MRLVTNKQTLAGRQAGYVPSSTLILGIIKGLPGRNDEVLVRHENRNYATMLAGVQRSINPILVRKLLESQMAAHCTCCDTSYTLSEWCELHDLGVTKIDDGEPPAALEYRNCPCGSTLGLGLDYNGVPIIPQEKEEVQ